MFGLIKKWFMGLLINIFNASNHTKCVLLKQSEMWDSVYFYQFIS